MTSTWTKETRSRDVADELKDQITGKTILITGASLGGLGGEAAYDISKYAKALIIVGPRIERLSKTEEKILTDHKNVKVHKIVADLQSWKSVRKAAEDINALGEPINVVILNALVQAREYTVGEDGHEIQFSADHLAHFILVKHVFPLILKAQSESFPPRIIVVSSEAHKWGSITFEDLTYNNGKEYDTMAAYARAKAANVLFAKELARRTKAADKGVVVFAVHPGAIQTTGFKAISKEDKIKIGILKPDGTFSPEFSKFEKQLDQGATAYLVAAFDPRVRDQSGSYFDDDGQIRDDTVSEFAKSPENAVRLWELSEKLTGEKFNI